MRLNKLVLSLVACGMAFSATSQAAKYGMAGCGVGSLIFEDKPGKIQILAVTTNQYFGQTSSITSGTSNCTESAGEMAALFITINHVALQKEISQGNGEALNALSQIYGCEDASVVGSSLQREYGNIFPKSEMAPEEVSKNVIDAMRRDNSVISTCKVLS